MPLRAAAIAAQLGKAAWFGIDIDIVQGAVRGHGKGDKVGSASRVYCACRDACFAAARVEVSQLHILGYHALCKMGRAQEELDTL